MDSPALTLVLLASVLAGVLLWWLGGPWLQRWRRQRIAARPFPAAWRRILRQRVPLFRSLPVDLQLQLKRLMQVFLADKPFIGCAGLQVTDEMRVVVAAQACLLLLNRPSAVYPRLRQVLLYPGAFAVDRVVAGGGGVLQERRQALAGESWSQGQVILSWQDVLDGAASADDGRNVVIHEFAHQLDQESGPANGAPYLGGRAHYARWAGVLGAEFERLRSSTARGETTVLSAYGATDPAEFFAVASEVFFEQPGPLAAYAPALYAELRAYYRVDPINW